MAIKIIRKGKEVPPSPETSAPAVSPVKEPLKIKVKSRQVELPPSAAGHVVKLGDFAVWPDLDFAEIQGHTKFIAHRKKPGIFYKLLAYGEEDKTLKLESVNGTVFDSKVHASLTANYRVVVGPEYAKEVPEDVLSYVLNLAEA